MVCDGNAYFVLSIANSSPPTTNNSSLGLPITPALRQVLSFLDDDAIPRTDVGETCERCPIADCHVRAAPPVVLEKQKQVRAIQERILVLRNTDVLKSK